MRSLSILILALPLAAAAGPAQFSEHTIADRKSTRLNSSHLVISYAVFCLKKKKTLDLPLSHPGVPGVHFRARNMRQLHDAPARFGTLLHHSVLIAIDVCNHPDSIVAQCDC